MRRFPFVLAIFGSAAGPVGEMFGASGGLGGGLLLDEAGVEGVKAIAPTESAGPASDGVMIFAKKVGDSGERTGVTELEEGLKGAESARRFAGEAGERRKLRVES